MFHLKSLGLALAVACAAPFTLSGCTMASGEHAAEQTGTIRSALSTTGSDGATYEFPPGSIAVIQGPALQLVPIDGSETVFTQQLATGTYQLGLEFPGDGLPALNRTENGTTTLVNVKWNDSPTVSFDISEGHTTNVVLHFSADTLGDITFDSGTIAVSAEVTRQVVTEVTSVDTSGSVTFSTETYADPNADYAAALDVGPTEPFTLGFQPTSEWQIQGDQVCRNGSLTNFSDSSDGLNNRLSEQFDTVACITDTHSGQDILTFDLSLAGPAPSNQQSFLPGQNYFFQLQIAASIPDVFDGFTLQQSPLSDLTITNGFFDDTIFDGATTLADAAGVFDGEIKFRP